jgi:hypothetical protein
MLYSCAIGIIAGIVGNKYRVENLHPSYTQTLNQYFLGIGNSSAGKSTAVDPLIFTILDKEREFMREYKKNKRQGLNPIDPRRIIENATHSEEVFLRIVSSNIEIETCRLALVPIGNESESHCYEFSRNYDGAIYYAYIDAKTGRQVQLFKVVEGTEGSLRM